MKNPELGDALRRLLEADGHDAFVSRVLARHHAALATATLERRIATRRAGVPTWNVLAGWARLGIAAALFVMLLSGIVIRPHAGSAATFESALFGGETPPDANILLAGTMGP
jgi:hypothetical protein